MAAAARVRETSDPELQADRLVARGLPRNLHPDDATAVTTLLRVAEGREGGFETTLLGRVFANGEDDEHRMVKIVVMGSERGSTVLVAGPENDHTFDQLTGLPGRDFLLDAIDSGLQGALNTDHRVGVFALDLDRFKRVNDTHGYAIGDETIRSIAAELIGELRPDDTLGRAGGDEFTVVCPDVLGVAEATTLGERFRKVCAEAPADSLLSGLTVSVGIAIGGPDRVAEDLLREAETALYQAKGLGRDRCAMFDDDLRTRSERRVTVDQILRNALDRDSIDVHFQPMVEIATGRIIGAEALLRLDDVDGHEPLELVRTAEDSGLIRQIEEQVLTHAASTIVGIVDAGSASVHLSVNVSEQRFNDSRFPLTLARALHQAALPAELVRLEVAPGVLRRESIGSRLVSQLRALGVGLTVDDFVTPVDSILLGRDGIDLVKLHRDLIANVHTDGGRRHAEMVMADLAGREVAVCAVGVETEADLEAVEALGCRFAQGYLFSPPVTGSEFSDLVVRRATILRPEQCSAP